MLADVLYDSLERDGILLGSCIRDEAQSEIGASALNAHIRSVSGDHFSRLQALLHIPGNARFNQRWKGKDVAAEQFIDGGNPEHGEQRLIRFEHETFSIEGKNAKRQVLDQQTVPLCQPTTHAFYHDAFRLPRSCGHVRQVPMALDSS